jgi:hypothetical protein
MPSVTAYTGNLKMSTIDTPGDSALTRTSLKGYGKENTTLHTAS